MTYSQLFNRFVLCLLLLVPLAIAREPEFGVRLEQDVQVPMRDGIKLATDVYRPAKGDTAVDERFPVILTRTPYDKGGNKSLGEYYAARGYVFAAQDTRGRYKSDGVWH